MALYRHTRYPAGLRFVVAGDHTVLERWILERRSLEYVLRVLGQAQFDVEFGRLDLRSLAEVGGR